MIGRQKMQAREADLIMNPTIQVAESGTQLSWFAYRTRALSQSSLVCISNLPREQSTITGNQDFSWNNVVVTVGTAGRHNSNLLCYQWEQSCYRDNAQLSVIVLKHLNWNTVAGVTFVAAFTNMV